MGKPTLSLGTHDDRLPLSREEFADAQFDEPWHYEREGGRLSVMSPAGYPHQLLVKRLCKQLFAYEDAHPKIVDEVFPEAWFAIDDETDRIADVAVYLHGECSGESIPERVPELVFEVVSEDGRERDYVLKRDDYRRAGVREYVVVDRFEQTLTVYRNASDAPEPLVLHSADTYATPLLPEFAISVGPLLAIDGA